MSKILISQQFRHILNFSKTFELFLCTARARKPIVQQHTSSRTRAHRVSINHRTAVSALHITRTGNTGYTIFAITVQGQSHRASAFISANMVFTAKSATVIWFCAFVNIFALDETVAVDGFFYVITWKAFASRALIYVTIDALMLATAVVNVTTVGFLTWNFVNGV